MPPLPKQVTGQTSVSAVPENLELLYHVKPDDSVVGPVERDRAHAEGILHRSGMIFLVRSDGRILIQRRNTAREPYPDSYDSSCSFHVTFGETYEAAAKRELKEETGVSAPLTYLGKFTHNDPPENEMVAVFARNSDEHEHTSKEEFSSAKFSTKEEVDKIIAGSAPWLRDGWQMAREKILLIRFSARSYSLSVPLFSLLPATNSESGSS